MALDEPSAQLYTEIRKEVQSILAARRPLLHHLNADSSWFLQLPRPDSALRNGSRVYYNILIDPWLAGGQSDVASWFSQQFHATASAVPTIAALEQLAAEIEALAAEILQPEFSRRPTSADGDTSSSLIDAVVISHEFTDHCHKDTLLEINPDVPVFANREAVQLINSWKHFRTVITLESFGTNGNTDWRSMSTQPLPDWISFSRLLQNEDRLYYHSAVLIAFNNKSTLATSKDKATIDSLEHEAAEAVIYTPHGIHSGDLNLVPAASPPIHTLAFLHGLHNVRIGTFTGQTALQLNLGAHNGLRAQKILNAKYWIGTHDEVKTGGGLVSWFLQRDSLSLQDALDRQRRSSMNAQDMEVVKSFDGVNWAELGNGESRVLV